MPRAHAAGGLLLALCVSALGCQRSLLGSIPSRAPEDAALAGPRTLGFIELRGAIPTPSSVGGGFVTSATDSVDAGASVSAEGEFPSDADVSAAVVVDSSAVSVVRAERGAAWVVQALPEANARAIDERGHRIALMDESVVDESARGASERLTFDDTRCDMPYDALSFEEDGAGYLVRRGRVFVRAPNATEWARTGVCTDVAGEPWMFSATRGGGVLARSAQSTVPVMMYTRELDGRNGWLAMREADTAVRVAVIDDDGSRLIFEHGGHPVVVDVTRMAAGAVLALTDVEFEGATRTRSGVVVWRQQDDDLDLLVARFARGSYRRERIARDAGTSTVRVLGVWTGALGQRIAVTTRGVEFYEAGRAHSAEVARWPQLLNTSHGINVGWLTDGRLAVVTPNAWAHQP